MNTRYAFENINFRKEVSDLVKQAIFFPYDESFKSRILSICCFVFLFFCHILSNVVTNEAFYIIQKTQQIPT